MSAYRPRLCALVLSPTRASSFPDLLYHRDNKEEAPSSRAGIYFIPEEKAEQGLSPGYGAPPEKAFGSVGVLPDGSQTYTQSL